MGRLAANHLHTAGRASRAPLASTPRPTQLLRPLLDAGIPQAAFFITDVPGEVARLRQRGVVFRGEPKKAGPMAAAT